MTWTSILPFTAIGVPLTLGLAGLAAPRRSNIASGVAVALALVFAVGTSLLDVGQALGVRSDVPTRVMLLLVAALGAVVVRFSRTYLEGERGIDRYHRWLLLTLSAVTLLVTSNNLLVIAVAWSATSLALHQLLTFYSDRPAARVAAHKKFLVSRLADGAVVMSLWLLYVNVDSFDLDRIAAWFSPRSHLPASMQVGAVLLVLAVALRSAQLPFHGWITQVMEAPTPVSALLHAGVVNIGGLVLIRLAPWMMLAEPARHLLVAVGLVTAVVAGLVGTTRVSVKVALAWSTCAQMGFMLVQCGLGLLSLALLHIVAHSLYKAYAFLGAGSAIDAWKARAFSTPAPPPTRRWWLGSAVSAVAAAFVGLSLLRPALGLAPLHAASVTVLSLLLGLSLVPLLAAPKDALGTVIAGARAGGVVLLCVGWHAVAEHLFPAPKAVAEFDWWMTGAGFVALFVSKSALERRPAGRLAMWLHPWLLSGLYLDDLFTRLAFRVWPPPPARRATVAPGSLGSPTPAEVQS